MTPPAFPSPEELFHRVRALRSLVVEMLGDEHAADDVLQEVWLTGRAKPSGSAQSGWAWLRGLARIEVLRRRRSERCRTSRERFAAKPEAQEGHAELDAGDRIALARAVLEEVQALEESDTRVLWLHYFEERSTAEIAHTSGVTPEAVRSRLFRARSRLRERLERRFGAGPEWRAAVAPLASAASWQLATTGAAVIAGGAAVKVKLLVGVIALAVLGGASWITWRGAAPEDRSREDLEGTSERALAEEPRATAVRAPAEGTSAAPTDSAPAVETPSAPRGPGILVVDASGKARAGVPVQLVERAVYGINSRWRGTTDSSGFAAFPPELEQLVEDIAEVAQIAATFDFPLARSHDVALDRDALPDEPLVLTLPETGSAELRFVDEAGAGPGFDLFVHLRGAARKLLESDPAHWNALQRHQLTSRSDRLLVPFLEIGCEIDVWAHWPQVDRQSVWRRFPGPTRDGEHVVLACLAGPRVPYLSGRLVGADGQAIPNAEFGVMFEETGSAMSRGGSDGTRTDAEGRFRLGLWRRDPPPETGTLRLKFAGHGAMDQAKGERQIAMPLALGVVELGDVVLVQPPIVASGVVRDRAGRPAAMVLVSLAMHPPGVRNYEDFAPQMTDAEGRFVYRAEAAGRRVVVNLHLDTRNVFERWDLAPGSPEALALELVMPERTGLAGAVLLDSEVEIPPLHLRAIDAQGAHRTVPLRSRSEEFVLALAAGTYRVVVDASGRENPRTEDLETHGALLLDVPDVRVEEGSLTRDPRLQAIDLRGRWRELRARLLDARGAPLRRKSVLLAPLGPDGAKGSYVARTDREGRLSRLVLREHGSFLLGVEAYRLRSIAWEPIEQTIQLQEGLEVELRLRDDAPRVEPPFVLAPMLRPKDMPSADALRALGPHTDFEGEIEGDRCTIRVPSPGSYKVHWYLRLRRGENYNGTPANVPEDPRIEVRDVVGPQVFEVAPHASAIEEAKRELTRDR